MSQNEQPTGSAVSRAAQRRAAVRKPVHARLGLIGPSGSGKTMTSLIVATEWAGATGQITVLDTERADKGQSASELYADQWNFGVIDWAPPYSPIDLAVTLDDLSRHAGPNDVVIIDSLSAFWTGPGGTMDIADGKFGGWKVATPVQEEMVAAIMRCACHIIILMRAKTDYSVTTEPNGRQKVERLGMAPIQRDTLEYELTVIGMMDTEHRISITKSRALVLADKVYGANHADEFAVAYKRWMDTGVVLASNEARDRIRAAVQSLKAVSVDEFNRVAREFKSKFGVVDQLAESVLPDAFAWLQKQGAAVDSAGAQSPPSETDGQQATEPSEQGSEAQDEEQEFTEEELDRWNALLIEIDSWTDEAVIDQLRQTLEERDIPETPEERKLALANLTWVPRETAEPETVQTLGDVIAGEPIAPIEEPAKPKSKAKRAAE